MVRKIAEVMKMHTTVSPKPIPYVPHVEVAQGTTVRWLHGKPKKGSHIDKRDAQVHQAVRELLPWFVVHALTDDEMALVRDHLRHCQQCWSDVEWQCRLVRLLRNLMRFRTLTVPVLERRHEWIQTSRSPCSDGEVRNYGPKTKPKEMSMNSMMRKRVAIAGCAVMLAGGAGMRAAQAASADMTFFITSAGPGKGGNLGGLEGADRHCQTLAKAAGAGQHIWHAYLSTQGARLDDPNFVNARDRIGPGPWHNATGVMIARSVEDLHSSSNNLTKQTALDEKGQLVNGRTDKPNKHDILTGSRPDGTAFPGAPFPDMTCGNWTRGGPDGSAMLGHHDRSGPIDASWAKSWNSSHPSRGCNNEGLQSTGGDGLLYCFAVK